MYMWVLVLCIMVCENTVYVCTEMCVGCVCVGHTVCVCGWMPVCRYSYMAKVFLDHASSSECV